jgi:hypothetical protein
MQSFNTPFTHHPYPSFSTTKMEVVAIGEGTKRFSPNGYKMPPYLSFLPMPSCMGWEQPNGTTTPTQIG